MTRASRARADNACPDVLNSWKEIAQYLGRGVRTVQRWEAHLGLPVRRPHGRSRSAVIAIRPELDCWLRSSPPEKPQHETSVPAGWLTSELVDESKRIRADVRDTRKQLREALTSFEESVRKILVGKGTA